MLTTRAWWLLFVIFAMLAIGLLASHPLLVVVGLALLLWFGWEWFFFNLRLQTTVRDLSVARVVEDERGPIATLWFGRDFKVRVRLISSRRLPFVRVTDFVPFGVEIVEGVTDVAGRVSHTQPLEVHYRVHCPEVGIARFEGVRVQIADFQGFFYHSAFVSAPVSYRVLPMLAECDTQTAATKRHNQLLPPGIHRLKRPGSGSELLDLRDYMTGDPPKTIAWKVSARRDKLITKEFESEVPVRCTLFVDISNSVRVPSREGKPIHRLIHIAASVVQANTRIRDLTGMCVFDEYEATFVRPERSGKHLTRVLQILADAAAQTPILDRLDPESLLALTFSYASEVYPRMVDWRISGLPFWGLPYWHLVLDAFPIHRRQRFSFLERYHRWKRPLFNWCLQIIPPISFIATALLLISAAFYRLPLWIYQIGLISAIAIPALAIVFMIIFVIGTLGLTIVYRSGQILRHASWRKRLAALFAVRYGLGPGGLAALLEDDDQFSLMIQRFLSEHQVPYRLPLYDADGSYLFAAPKKVSVLATALIRAVGKGRDNELYVLLVDLLELDEHLDPLLRAVRVALGRHHQVIVVCPWPAGMRLPGDEPVEAAVDPLNPATQFRLVVRKSLHRRFRDAYHRLRHTFARLGVPLLCAASEEPVSLILNRLDRLRSPRRMR